MSDVFPSAIRQSVEKVVQAHHVSGVVVLVTRHNEPVENLVWGVDADGQPLTQDTLFPVASVTKLATSLAALRLVDQGALDLDRPLSVYLPDAAAAQSGVTLRLLLSHISGLPVDVAPAAAPYAPGLDWPQLAQACLACPLQDAPRTVVRYSNVGYGLLALVVERQTGQAFPDALAALVLRPLGVEAYLGQESARPPARLADVRGRHKGSDLEPFNSAFWRSLALPWAGLVTTPRGALTLNRVFLGYPADFLKPTTRAEAITNQVGDLGGDYGPLDWPRSPWGLGPELRGEKTPHWGPTPGPADSFGHAGASGCVAWADPTTGVAYTLHGTKVADSGWLVRGASQIGAAILAAKSEATG